MLNTSPISDESIVARTKFSIDCEKAETLIYFVISAWRKGGGIAIVGASIINATTNYYAESSI